MVGRFGRADRLRAGHSPPGAGRPGRPPQPQPHRNRGVRAADQPAQMGRRAGNVLLTAAASGLDRDSAANVSLIVAIDKAQLVERVGKVTARKLERVLAGVDVVFGR